MSLNEDFVVYSEELLVIQKQEGERRDPASAEPIPCRRLMEGTMDTRVKPRKNRANRDKHQPKTGGGLHFILFPQGMTLGCFF